MRNLRLYNTDADFKAHEQSAGGDGSDTVTVVPGVSMSSDQRKRYFNPHDTSILVQEVKVNYCIGNYSLATGKTRVKYVSGISTDAYVNISPAPIKGKPYTISQPFADVVIPPDTSTTVSAKCAPNFYVKCTYDVTTTGSATRIYYSKPSYMWGIVVDGETFISGNSVSTGRTFSTTGKHEVVFCFSGTNISLMSNAFQNCTRLTSVEICSGFTTIGSRCFSGCYSITSITIPNGITQLQTYCFDSCSALKELEIPSSVTSIGDYCFSYCSSLTNVTLSGSLTNLPGYCFQNCSSLSSITCNATVAPTIYSNTFYGVDYGGTLYYPSGSNYSTWLNSGGYYLGYYNWTGQEI